MSARPPFFLHAQNRLALGLVAAATALVLGASPSAYAERGLNRVQKLEAREDSGRTVITIHGSATPTFTVYKLERPERVVLDLSGTQLGMSLDGPVAVNTWAVGQLAAQELGDPDAKLTRVIVSFARPSTYQVKAVGDDVVVTVTPRDPKPAGVVDPRAREDAERARAEASAAKADAQAARDEAARAKADAEAAKAQAAKAQADAAAREQAAEARMKDAQAARAKAADEAKAAQAAERKAQAAEASGAADAQARRAEAERAAQAADARRKDAEKKTQEAEAALARAEEAKRAAERERKQLQSDAEAARTARDRAEAERAGAERARKVEEERAARVAEKRAEEERRTQAAGEARVAEEAAAKAAADRRASAEAARRDEEAKLVALESSRREAEKAQAAARTGRAQADAAAAEAKRVAAAEGPASARARDAEAKASTAEAARKRAEADLAKKEAALAAAKAEAGQATAAKAQAQADARDARAAAQAAEKARLAEEARMGEIARARKLEEDKLAEARRLRAKEEAALATAEARRREVETTPVPKAATKPAAGGTVRVANVDYVDKDDRARVVVALSGEAQPEVIASSGRQAILSIPAADIPAALERSLDVSEFDGPVVAVSSYRDPKDPTRVRVVVELAQPAKATLTRAGNTWYWDFARSADAVAVRQPAAAPKAARAVAYEPPVVGGYGVASTPVTSQTVAQKKKVFRGKRVELDFRDVDIHNLLRLLARVGDVDIVIPDDVKATVTIRMTDVPWDQAMEVILQSKGLWYRREGRIIRIADRKILDAEDEEAARIEKLKLEREAPEAVIFTLNYSVAKDVVDQAKTLLSPKGSIEVDERTNSVIISDLAINRAKIIELLTALDTQTPQIQIEARVVEARSTWSREIGVQWGINALASAGGGNPTGLIFPSTVGVSGGATDNATPRGGISGNPDFAVNLPAAVATGGGGALGFTFGSVGGNFNLTLRLSAAEQSGTVRIVNAPKISALNNVKAEISQGVSIPIQTVSAQGTQTIFVDAELKLSVTPHVSQRDCSIQLEVEVTKNEPDFVNTGARGDPSILKKEARTTMLIADGETTVIGGIYTRNTGSSVSKVPFFGDIPILGYFFRFKAENDDRTEMLIFLTPKITNKASLRCEGRR